MVVEPRVGFGEELARIDGALAKLRRVVELHLEDLGQNPELTTVTGYSGGAMAAALRLANGLSGAVITVIVCDRGDRYLSSGVFPSE